MSEKQAATVRSTTIEYPAGRSGDGLIRRVGGGVVLCAMLVAYAAVAGPMMLSAISHLTTASTGAVFVGLGATAGSMVAFAALRRRTLLVGGSRIPLRRTLALSYGAGALHTTLPAGTVFSTNYAFRKLRSWGASVSATTWSMTITGLLATLTLAALGVLGVALQGGGSALASVGQMLAAVAIIASLVFVARRPDGLVRLLHRLLVRFNRLRRRPAETGYARLAEAIGDLRAIRPSSRDWLAATSLAVANWLLDLACLAACCAAVGIHVSLPALLITYTAGMAAGSLLPLPGGLGAVEAALTLGLTVAGAAASPALAAVLLYRLLSIGSVVVVGWIIVAAQRVHFSSSQMAAVGLSQVDTPSAGVR